MDIRAYNAGAAASCLMVGSLRAQTARGIAATAVATTCGIAAVGATRVGWRAGRSCGLVAAMFGLDTNAEAEAITTTAAANLREDAISARANVYEARSGSPYPEPMVCLHVDGVQLLCRVDNCGFESALEAPARPGSPR